MSFGGYLFCLLVQPIKLIFEFLFFYAYAFTNNVGLSIVVLSLAINILVLPLYNRADLIQKEAREKEDRLRPMADHIKKSFKGDERIMMLQTYYGHMHYSPLSSVKSSLSLILQIPFFIAAYSFLVDLRLLVGQSLGPIADLSVPDHLIRFGSVSLNLLPIAMTVINIASSEIFTRGKPFKSKITLYVIALFFLVFLYNCPSGLVFYWTLNNVFSLCKNIVTAVWKPKKKTKDARKAKKQDTDTFLIFSSGALAAVLSGLLIPSEIVYLGMFELINVYGDPHNPLLYLVNSALVAIGTFIIWIPLFYYLTKDHIGKCLLYVMPVLGTIGIINYVIFNSNFGVLSQKLIYVKPMSYETNEIIYNLAANVLCAIVVVFAVIRYRKAVRFLTVVAAVGMLVLCIRSLSNTIKSFPDYNFTYSNTIEEISIPMTTEGQNVVVIMMDRMINGYIPYIFNERPDVAAQFDGFTYYPNTVSYGQYTLFGLPSIYGGYEYTPSNMNARPDELLLDKTNESLRVMPTIFADNGWNVTVGDPSYANFRWFPDPTLFDDDERINAYQLAGVLNSQSDILNEVGYEYEIRLNRNFYCFGLMKMLPYFMQPWFYTNGSYCYCNFYYDYTPTSYRNAYGYHVQPGLKEDYIMAHLVLEYLDDLVDIQDTPQNCFFLLTNTTTHDTSILAEPSYEPQLDVDNTAYDEAHMDRFTLNGVTMDMETSFDSYSHYESNMAACIALGNWFDYLRANGLYDNTRIIIVADHGRALNQFDYMLLSEPELDVESVNPVLLVKDFGSTGFTTSYDFMTNADTPFLALNGIVDNPVNPFTGNPISDSNKIGDQLIYISERPFTVDYQGHTQFDDPEGYWLTVRDNIFEENNWNYYNGEG